MSNVAVFINTGATTITVGDGLTGDGSGGNPVVVEPDGSTLQIDGSGKVAIIDPLTLTELDATTVQAAYKSSDGTAGATAGPFTVITAIRVKNGLVTTLTGS